MTARAGAAEVGPGPGDDEPADEARDPPPPSPGEIRIMCQAIREAWGEERWEMQRMPIRLELQAEPPDGPVFDWRRGR